MILNHLSMICLSCSPKWCVFLTARCKKDIILASVINECSALLIFSQLSCDAPFRIENQKLYSQDFNPLMPVIFIWIGTKVTLIGMALHLIRLCRSQWGQNFYKDAFGFLYSYFSWDWFFQPIRDCKDIEIKFYFGKLYVS